MKAFLREHAAALLLLVPAWFVLFQGLASYDVVNGDEAFYHAVALHMLESGDPLTLEFRGEPRIYDTFMNAPLQYLWRMAAIAVFGDGLLAMRIHSALFALATIALCYGFGRRLAGETAGLLAALAQLTTFHFVYVHAARTGELETAVSLLLLASAWLFWRFIDSGRGVWWHHACVLAIANVKAPLWLVALAAELVAFVVLPVARPRLRRWLATLAVAAPIGLAWHELQFLRMAGPGWDVARRMWSEASGSAQDVVAGGVFGNLEFYFFALLYGAFPYSLVYPFALIDVLRRARGRLRVAAVVLALFAAVLLVFHLLVAKHYRWYVVPMSPFLSLLLGVWLAGWAGRRAGKSLALAVAVALTGLVIVRVPLASLNPFALRALDLPLAPPLRSLFGLPPLYVAPVLLVAFAVAARSALRALGERSGSIAAALLAVALVTTGALRVSFPLQHLGYRSEMATLRARIDAARAAGERIPLPLPVDARGDFKVRYYFADDFEIVRGRTLRASGPNEPSPSYWLLAPDDPRARHGSIRRGSAGH